MLLLSRTGESATAGSPAAESGSAAAKGGGDGASQQPGKQGASKADPNRPSDRKNVEDLSVTPDLLYLRRDLRSAAAWRLCRQSGTHCCAPLETETPRFPP